MLVKFSFPLYLLVKSPWECDVGFDGVAFGQALLSTKECVALFHDELEAREFATGFGLDDATVCECQNYDELYATLQRARARFKFEYAGWPAAKADGFFDIVPIRDLRP